MGGFEFSNIPDYQKKLDILAVITPFRPGMFISANQDEVLRLCDGQIEIAEDELKRWAERHPEDGRTEIKSRVIGANPLKVKILEARDPELEIIESDFRDRKERQRRRKRERRFLE